MTFGELLRESSTTVTRMWKRARAEGRLPPWCTDVIGISHAEALYAGALVQQAAKDESLMVGTAGRETAQFMRWAATGFPQFALTASAAAAFVLTDTTGVRWGDVRLPFGDFLIFLPTPSPIVFDAFDGREQEVRCIQVSQHTAPSITNEQISEVMKRHDEAWRTRRPTAELQQIIADLAEVPALWVQGASAGSEGIQRTYFKHADPQHTLADWCDPGVTGRWQSERSRHAMSLVCRVVACLAMYLDHAQGPEQRWDPSLLKANIARGKPTTWDIGRELKLPKDLREAARVLGRADKDPAKWSVQSRLLVRGHWKNQPYGQARAERRKQWIQPYWRGEETGAVMDRLYKIGEQT